MCHLISIQTNRKILRCTARGGLVIIILLLLYNVIYGRWHPKPSEQKKKKTDLDILLDRIKTDQEHFRSDEFTKARLRRMWPAWNEGLKTFKELVGDTNCSLKQSRNPCFRKQARLNILLHMGLLTLQNSLGIEENVRKGGPLGELVQWTDLIAGIYLLGHNLTVSKSTMQTKSILESIGFAPCDKAEGKLHVIFTDIRGYREIRRMKLNLPECMFRILDSFGTQSQYNRKAGEPYGGLNLNLQQFYTLFPHSPDNTFLGFVVEKPLHALQRVIRPTSGKPLGLVAGKAAYMWRGLTPYLEILSEFLEIHGNVADGNSSNLPAFVINHKMTYGYDYLNLLNSVQVLIGLGFPFEGPAPLEAIANGIVFLNMRLKPPHGRARTPFFAGKPTDRELHSQHPYIEEYIGEPYSYILDKDNPDQIRETMRRLLANPLTNGYRTFEFTEAGYLERLNAFLEHQEFCNTSVTYPKSSPDPYQYSARFFNWPPKETGLYSIRAFVGESCATACSKHKPTKEFYHQTEYLERRNRVVEPGPNMSVWNRLYCAPEHFPTVNRDLNVYAACQSEYDLEDSRAPYYDPVKKDCVRQKSPLWFDCMKLVMPPTSGSPIERICPCRDSLIGQSALCKACV
ncbi:Alpha-1,6-mannosylglycoprotein 6-beta-N-acetylglucosaminyltransferase A [Clonorchis sinensis]|uniref:alpha-1,6-mannosyl-glycoprotein 6-beta-N-acetylglucosaminyltransferase n=1 Tax=Clonorchis sinensis TaxID=79923 RepID=A0A3R7C6L6_CLOSI|nr:Alpha-1,6-mannosylglycoprotein 6-beta-N-acetylglucosaminyltransferase A [Clonorchis sinensis]